MLWTLLFACTLPEPAHCEAYAEEADAPAVLDWDTNCGTWRLPLGEYVAISVQVADENTVCQALHDDALSPRDPSFANMSNDVAKRVFQTDAVAPTGDAPSHLDIVCDDAVVWSGDFYVE